jgi:hypothetical protein
MRQNKSIFQLILRALPVAMTSGSQYLSLPKTITPSKKTLSNDDPLGGLICSSSQSLTLSVLVHVCLQKKTMKKKTLQMVLGCYVVLHEILVQFF